LFGVKHRRGRPPRGKALITHHPSPLHKRESQRRRGFSLTHPEILKTEPSNKEGKKPEKKEGSFAPSCQGQIKREREKRKEGSGPPGRR